VPLYEYQCGQCGRFELIQKFSDPALQACPTCGGAVQKLLSAPAIQFKGSGWYVNDYAKKSSGKEGEGKAPGDTSSSASSGDKAGPKDAGDAPKSASKDSSATGSTPAK
jgi:putative FmdB family regulatory protein